MAKKWAIRKGKPMKVRVVGMTEDGSNNEAIVNRTPRVRIVSRIAKILVAIGLLSIGSWLQACHHATDGVQDTIDGHGDSFDMN